MKKVAKATKTNDGMQIIDRRFLRDDKKLKKMVDEEFQKLQIGQQIFKLRKEAGLTQQELADFVGTTGSVISRLESAEYDGHSLKMLEKIAIAFGKKVDVRIVDREEHLQPA
jgi:DNA-binding XRE family transcriptional regulator